jgi:hypothetical protein
MTLACGVWASATRGAGDLVGGTGDLVGGAGPSVMRVPAVEEAPVLARQWAEYQADAPKTILELQPFRRATGTAIIGPDGRRGFATLTNLNPRVNAWYLLTLAWTEPEETEAYHLENARPGAQEIRLDAASGGLAIVAGGMTAHCPLWQGPGPSGLHQARSSRLPYAPLCGDRLSVRNAVAGTFTTIERVTGFLRDHVWGGDRIVTFVREHVYQDAYAEQGVAGGEAFEPDVSPLAPQAAGLDPGERSTTVHPADLGMDAGSPPGRFLLGRWYPVNGLPGMYVSVMRPGAVPSDILASSRRTVNALDSVESQALDYLVAMDLDQFELHFALGTDYPQVAWSARTLESARDPRLPGPDGIGSVAPLVVNGMVNPALLGRTAATFAGGFKREHGAFRYGALAQIHHGSHYGFMERGVVFSKLQPGLATLYVRTDGRVDMKSWTAAADASLDGIQDARQNGLALIETDPRTRMPVPGSMVNQWGAGNWSGSVDERLRTLRGGACLQETATRRFLLFGYFSTATPSAMARVFQAYQCSYAMQLDINALEHTYFALYTHDQGHLVVQHLVDGMAEVDRKGGAQLAPRFLGFPDDRDFFYVLRREAAP